MYQIKQLPEDFVVREKLNLKLDDNGEYSYFLLKKKECTTFDAIQLIAKKLRLNSKFINAAGLKDKIAVTEQLISISRGPKADVEINKDLFLEFVGSGCERLNIGTLEGNEFEIVVRNMDKDYVPDKKEYIVNYFDDQRFGKDKDNHEIGRMIIKKQFMEAAKVLEKKNTGRIAEYLKANPTNFIGALRSLQKNLLRFYIASYQSYLWNESVKKYIELSEQNNVLIDNDDKFIQVGFDVLENDRVKKQIIDEIMKAEQIKPMDFVVRSIPELTLESQERRIYAKVENLKIGKQENDELNYGKYKIKVSFYLGKGSYATNVIKELFGGPKN